MSNVEEAKRKLALALSSTREVDRESAIHQAIAALSAGIANKAEVEPVAYMASDKRMLAFADWVKQDFAYRSHGMVPLYVKPTAASGESTAPENANPVTDRELAELRKLVSHGGVYGAEFVDGEQLMACFWSVIGQINKQLESKSVGASTARSIDTIDFHNLLRICMKHGDDYPTHSARLIDYINRHFAGSIGASTVVTDERIEWILRDLGTKAADRGEPMTSIDFARAIEREVATQAGQVAVPDDPMDSGLPCDIKVGNVTIRKGCKLRTLVTRMESLHRMAMAALPVVTPEQRAEFDSMFPRFASISAAAPSPAKESK